MRNVRRHICTPVTTLFLLLLPDASRLIYRFQSVTVPAGILSLFVAAALRAADGGCVSAFYRIHDDLG